MRQRLEFGPGDDDAEFLDDIVVAVGAATEPLTGGYQLLQRVEIGPLVVAARGSPPGDDEFVDLDVPEPTIVCSDADVCASVATLKAEYDREHGTVRSHRARWVPWADPVGPSSRRDLPFARAPPGASSRSSSCAGERSPPRRSASASPSSGTSTRG